MGLSTGLVLGVLLGDNIGVKIMIILYFRADIGILWAFCIGEFLWV